MNLDDEGAGLIPFDDQCLFELWELSIVEGNVDHRSAYSKDSSFWPRCFRHREIYFSELILKSTRSVWRPWRAIKTSEQTSNSDLSTIKPVIHEAASGFYGERNRIIPSF